MKNSKRFIAFLFIIVLFTMLLSTAVEANYQSNGGTKVTIMGVNWIVNIRNMEKSGQVMGLTETINSTTLKATSTPNNIDVHMIKNTEWGAIALLSASQDYGKKGKGTARYVIGGSGLQTTTGNASGMYITNSKVCTASGGNNFVGSKDSRYNDLYEAGVSHVGDARINWHGGTNGWRDERAAYSDGFFVRGGSSLFYGAWTCYNANSNARTNPSFATITNGEGV